MGNCLAAPQDPLTAGGTCLPSPSTETGSPSPSKSSQNSLLGTSHSLDGIVNSPPIEPGLAAGSPNKGFPSPRCLRNVVQKPKLCSELELLADLNLSSVLGSGAYGLVLKGHWRGSTPVAVKLFATRPPSTAPGPCAPGDLSQMPLRALSEALLSRDLSHPNIVTTYDVRCCWITPAFMAGLQSWGSTQLPKQFMLQPQGGHHLLDTVFSQPPDATAVCSMFSTFSSYHGLTPLLNSAPHCLNLGSEGEVSLDGFGPAQAQLRLGLSWKELVKCIGAEQGDCVTVLVQQYATKGTLAQAIKDGAFMRDPHLCRAVKRRRLRALLRTAKEMAMGLGHLHSCNVVHGDIKPANVLLNASPSDARGYTAQLADFGLARALQPGQGITFQGKSTVGTASYMSPEALLEGKLSYQSDIFSLGMCLFEMVHGVGAHDGHSMRQVLLSALHSDLPEWQAPDEAQLPGLKSIYFRCIAEPPGDRPSASDLVAALTQLERAARAEAQQEMRQLGAAAQAAGPCHTPHPLPGPTE
ncbi:kinase-like domain-containing protein [Haematococcus lacustris]